MDTETKTDGRTTVELDQRELSVVVRAAVTDALVDVLSSVALLVFALFFVAWGVQARFAASRPSSIVISGGLLLIGLAMAAVALEFVPISRD